MPVVVTGAGGFVGRALVRRLVPAGGEVRALVRTERSREGLRPILPKVAVADLGDVETLATMFHDAHTVVHLAGGLDRPDEAAYERDNHVSAVHALAAAEEAGVRRFLLLSYPGADPVSGNAYLRAKGRAEAAVAASSIPERVVVRSTHAYGPGSAWLAAMRRLAGAPVAALPGPGTQQLAPVFVEDVAAVLAAADGRDAVVGGTFALEGPDVLTADALVERLAGRRRRVVHLSPERAAGLTRLIGRPLSRPMLEVLAAGSRADAPDAAAEFGVERTPLAEGLARSSPDAR